MSRALLLIVFVAFVSIFTVVSQIRQVSSISGENVMEVQNAAFAFGWSGITGEKWTVNNQTIMLNNEAFAMPPSTPINGDAGTIQANHCVIYENNIGFSYGWSANVGEKYRPSATMEVSPPILFNNYALVPPPSEAFIPEFPSFLILPLFIIATLVAVMLLKRKQNTKK